MLYLHRNHGTFIEAFHLPNEVVDQQFIVCPDTGQGIRCWDRVRRAGSKPNRRMPRSEPGICLERIAHGACCAEHRVDFG